MRVKWQQQQRPLLPIRIPHPLNAKDLASDEHAALATNDKLSSLKESTVLPLSPTTPASTMQNKIGDNFNFHSSSTITIAVSFQQFQFSILNKRCISNALQATGHLLPIAAAAAAALIFDLISVSSTGRCPSSSPPAGSLLLWPICLPCTLNGNFQKLEKFPPESDNKIKLFPPRPGWYSVRAFNTRYFTAVRCHFRAPSGCQSAAEVPLQEGFLVLNYLAGYSISKVGHG